MQGILWGVWSCCVTSRASPNLVPVYCLFPQTYLLGIIISICGNVLISISLNIQVGSTGNQLNSRCSVHGRHVMPVKTHFTLSEYGEVAFLLTVFSLLSRLHVFIRSLVKVYVGTDLLTCSQQALCSRQ